VERPSVRRLGHDRRRHQPQFPGARLPVSWGSPNGLAWLDGLRSLYTRSLYFIVDKSTFGVDLYTPRRIRFAYNVLFTSEALTDDFPDAGDPPTPEILNASITIGGDTLAAETLFELASGADPYFTNIDPSPSHTYFYLSQDLRVFSGIAGLPAAFRRWDQRSVGLQPEDHPVLRLRCRGNPRLRRLAQRREHPHPRHPPSSPWGQDKLWAYSGCYLDVYDASNQSLFPGTHHCIMAEIAYDETPLANSGGVTLTPENSDKLAQRNLQITPSGNPGYPDTHRIPQTFDTRPSPPSTGTGELLDYPDELMIDWGNVPPGSMASIYWPAVDAQAVLDLATSLYGTHKLYAADPHTLTGKTTAGVAYIPIPRANPTSFAGLFTIDLPTTIRRGQEFTVEVRRVTSRRPRAAAQPVLEIDGFDFARGDARKRTLLRNWRYVTGTFQVKIPVGDDETLRLAEERTLSILKWRLSQYKPTYHGLLARHRPRRGSLRRHRALDGIRRAPRLDRSHPDPRRRRTTRAASPAGRRISAAAAPPRRPIGAKARSYQTARRSPTDWWS
jgi:hypothetical protein